MHRLAPRRGLRLVAPSLRILLALVTAAATSLVTAAVPDLAAAAVPAPAQAKPAAAQATPAEQLQAWLAAGDFARAESMLRDQMARRVATGQPPAPALERLLGSLLLADLRLEAAEHHLDRATRLRPDVARWWRELAAARAASGHCAAALPAYDRALELDLERQRADALTMARTRLDKARCARAAGQDALAEVELRRGLEETAALSAAKPGGEPGLSRPLDTLRQRGIRELATLLRDRGPNDGAALSEARHLLRALVAKTPDDAETWLLLGLTERDLSRIAVPTDPSGHGEGHAPARGLARPELEAAARASLERALALRPEDARTLYALGRLLGPTVDGRELLNRFAVARQREEVIENRRQFLQLSPRDLAVRRELAGLLVAAGRLDEAAEQRRIVERLERSGG